MGAPGVAWFDIFVSDNGGPFTLWQARTTGTGAIFNGVPGHTYAFYSVATDNAGDREADHTTPDAVTTAVGTVSISGTVSYYPTKYPPDLSSNESVGDVVINLGLGTNALTASDGTYSLRDLPFGVDYETMLTKTNDSTSQAKVNLPESLNAFPNLSADKPRRPKLPTPAYRSTAGSHARVNWRLVTRSNPAPVTSTPTASPDCAMQLLARTATS